MFVWLTYLDRRTGEDMADHYIELPKYLGEVAGGALGKILVGMQDEDTFRHLIHLTDITGGGDIKSMHLEDDSTSYQNTSGQDAYFALEIFITNSTGTRDIAIYSSPNDNSKTSATLVHTINSPNFGGTINRFWTTPVLRVQNNEYIVVENNSAASDDLDIRFNSLVVERG